MDGCVMGMTGIVSPPSFGSIPKLSLLPTAAQHSPNHPSTLILEKGVPPGQLPPESDLRLVQQELRIYDACL